MAFGFPHIQLGRVFSAFLFERKRISLLTRIHRSESRFALSVWKVDGRPSDLSTSQTVGKEIRDLLRASLFEVDSMIYMPNRSHSPPFLLGLLIDEFLLLEALCFPIRLEPLLLPGPKPVEVFV
jgi:hypothetical protein